jgi:hypothetical protein
LFYFHTTVTVNVTVTEVVVVVRISVHQQLITIVQTVDGGGAAYVKGPIVRTPVIGPVFFERVLGPIDANPVGAPGGVTVISA